MDIVVNLNDLKQIRDNFYLNVVKDEFLVLNNYCFTINNICTLIPAKSNKLDSLFSFSFSYNDEIIKERINVKYNNVSSSCKTFLETSKLISENDLEELLTQVKNVILNKYKKSQNTLENSSFFEDIKNVKYFDSILFQEAQIFLTSKINTNDKDMIKDDFASKYNQFKENAENENEESHQLMIDIYNKILKRMVVNQSIND